MKLIPKPWSWNGQNPKRGWLDGPADIPVVWLARLTNDEVVRRHLASLLSADERLRLERLRVAEDQLRFLIGRGLLRILAAAQLKLTAEEVMFAYGSAGKPFLASSADGPPLQFNVSHSGDLVALAFHSTWEVGEDVEAVRASADWEAVARQTFSTEECRSIMGLDLDQRVPAFFRAWTRHEAWLKAAGTGFSSATDATQNIDRRCFELELPEGYEGAVACQSQINAS
jgi:4'-phosphopantetheinyl transferase